MRLCGRQSARRLAKQGQHFVADNAHDLLRGCQALQNFLVDRPVANTIDERLDDLEVDVRLEQSHPDLAEGGFDGRFRETRFPAKRTKYSLQAVAERFKH